MKRSWTKHKKGQQNSCRSINRSGNNLRRWSSKGSRTRKKKRQIKTQSRTRRQRSEGSRTRNKSITKQQKSCKASSKTPNRSIEVIESRFYFSRTFILFSHLFIFGVRDWPSVDHWLHREVWVVSNVNKPQCFFFKIMQGERWKSRACKVLSPIVSNMTLSKSSFNIFYSRLISNFNLSGRTLSQRLWKQLIVILFSIRIAILWRKAVVASFKIIITLL